MYSRTKFAGKQAIKIVCPPPINCQNVVFRILKQLFCGYIRVAWVSWEISLGFCGLLSSFSEKYWNNNSSTLAWESLLNGKKVRQSRSVCVCLLSVLKKASFSNGNMFSSSLCTHCCYFESLDGRSESGHSGCIFLADNDRILVPLLVKLVTACTFQVSF